MSSLQKTGKKEISILVFIGIVSLLGLAAPFSHIFYDDSVPGVLGFPKMSSFLFAVGFPVLSVSAGVLFYFVSRKLTGVLAKGFSFIAFLFAYVGIFFLTWIFIPFIKDFNSMYYYLSIIGITFTVTWVLFLFSKYIFGIVGKIDLLISLIGTIRRKHFFPMASKAADKDNIEHIKRDMEKFDDDVFETLKKLAQ